MAFFCFALAGLLLVASLQAQGNPKPEASAKTIVTSSFFANRTL